MIRRPPEWTKDAACVPTDPDAPRYNGFTELPVAMQKLICDTCKHDKECLAKGEAEPHLASLAADPNGHVWGGKTPTEIIGDRMCQRCQRNRAVTYCAQCQSRLELLSAAREWDGTIYELADAMGRKKKHLVSTIIRKDDPKLWREMKRRERRFVDV